jgi:hypothetical protein
LWLILVLAKAKKKAPIYVLFFGFCQSQKPKKATTNTPEDYTVVRASLREPVKTRTEKHEFSTPNSHLRAEKWQVRNKNSKKNAHAGSEPVKGRVFHRIHMQHIQQSITINQIIIQIITTHKQ